MLYLRKQQAQKSLVQAGASLYTTSAAQAIGAEAQAASSLYYTSPAKEIGAGMNTEIC
jgi:hypothetical protein